MEKIKKSVENTNKEKNSFSDTIKNFETKIWDLSEKISKIHDSQNELIKDSTNFSEIKWLLDSFSEQINNLSIQKDKLENEKNEILIERKKSILWKNSVEEVKNQMESSMWSISWWLHDRIVEISRIFLWWTLSDFEIEEIKDKKWKDLYVYALDKFYSDYIYWTDAQKVDASDFFKSIVEALRAANNPVQNISKDIWTKLWVPLWAAWITLISGWTLPLALAVWWAWIWRNSLNYNTKNKIKDQFDKKIVNNDAIWEKWYEKVETLAWPVWWWIKWIRKSIWWLLWWWKAWLKWWIVAWAATAEIAWWIPWLKWSLWKVTNWLTGNTYKKFFWDK